MSGIDRSFRRREVLQGAGLIAGSLLLPRLRARAEGFALSDGTKTLLRESDLVYISPIRKDGTESRCHGEVWFFFDQGEVVICTGRKAWKARAIEAKRDQARIWVGDFGRGDDVGDRYKAAPTFLTRAREDTERATFDRLLQRFAEKYPDGWGKWEPRFRDGYDDGSRAVIRYEPIDA